MDFEVLRIVHYVVIALSDVAGLLGNALVIASVARFDHMRTSSNYLVCFLAVNDATMSAGSLAFIGEDELFLLLIGQTEFERVLVRGSARIICTHTGLKC